jgi:hypothetical protein
LGWASCDGEGGEERGLVPRPIEKKREGGKREKEREGEMSPLRVCSLEKERKRERGGRDQ